MIENEASSPEIPTENLTLVERLKRDVAAAGKSMTPDEARFLVDQYYAMQEDRIRFGNQARALGETGEPHTVIQWLGVQSNTLEAQIKRALDHYAHGHPVGEWAMSIYGIGPVIAAGLLAHISMNPWRCHNPKAKKACKPGEPCSPECGYERTESAGQIWRYAGLDPTVTWEKGQKRPWNTSLKTLCWKIGQSFMKFAADDECYYGHVYRQRKQFEIERNERGDNVDAVAQAKVRIGDTTDSMAWLTGCYDPVRVRQLREAGYLTPDRLKQIKQEPGTGVKMLPPGQIDARARRYAVKLFLSHLHDVWYRHEFERAPNAPYPIAFMQHTHFIPVPAGKTKEKAAA